MISCECVPRIFFLILLCASTIATTELNKNNTKFFFGLYNSVVSTSKPKPTAAIVHHEPGVPPGWSTRTPSLHYLHRFPSTDQKPPNYQEPNKGFIDWVLGIVGITTTPKPLPFENGVKNCPKCSCGITFKHNRIVGGVETQVNEYPWMTALTYNGRFYCGASVISDKYLLTAAHCAINFSNNRLSAIFLDHDRSSTTETKRFSRKITSVIRHRGYGVGGNYNNDIALLKLDKPLEFTGLMKPVCLPATGKSFTGHTGIATGWGAIEQHGAISNKLLEVKVPIIANIDCRKTGYGNKITDNMLCAGYPEGMKDSCQGDSGGPLHVDNGTAHTIVGIVSWGEGCAEANFPGVYTRVNRYISWIKSNTQDACYC